MTLARAATAAAVAGLVAVAAWSFPGPGGGGRSLAGAGGGAATAWQLQATDWVGIAPAADVELAVIDSGANLTSSAFSGVPITTYDIRTHTRNVGDGNGHGTVVASLAAASGAHLLIIKAADASGSMSGRDEAAAIRYAVASGARVINLSIAGTTTSAAERDAVRYAVAHGVLIVAAAGNDFSRGNPTEYPAALLSGAGLAVGASTARGDRAAFSSTGSWVALAAPGENVDGMSGTSFAAPQVAGAAAAVWQAAPSLTARAVASVLEQTASGHGAWSAQLGYGVIDVGAAITRARALASGM